MFPESCRNARYAKHRGVDSEYLVSVLLHKPAYDDIEETGVRQYAYDDNGERYDVDYKITQAEVDGYTTDNATVGNEGVITNTHEVEVAPQPEPQPQPQPQPQPEEQQVATELAETGDQAPSTLVALALGASALGIAVVAKRRSKR